MALVKGICKNYEECYLADNKEIQEAEKTNFVCSNPVCKQPLYEVKPTQPTPPAKKWVVILIIAIFLLLCGIGVYWFMPSDEGLKPLPTYRIEVTPDSCTLNVGDSIMVRAEIIPYTTDSVLTWSSSDSNIATVSNGLIRAIAKGQAIITVINVKALPAQISVNITADSVKVAPPTDAPSTDTTTSEEKPIPPYNKTSQSTPPIRNLKGASFSGTLKNGVPHGRGILTFKRRQLIDAHDEKKHIAESGEWLDGEWYYGHFVSGAYHKNDRTVPYLDFGKPTHINASDSYFKSDQSLYK